MDFQNLHSAMSFNIFNWDRSEAHLLRIVAMIKKYSPDTVGFQEITLDWINRLLPLLPEYACIGADREDSTHERACIFYRRNEFILLEGGTKWLSDTPDIPSKFESSQYNRIMTYACLEHGASGKRLVHANLHLDLSDPVNQKQVKVALDFLESHYPTLPRLLSGDFNSCRLDVPLPTTMKEALARMSDSRDLATEKHGTGTWHGRHSITPEKVILDYIFVSGNITVEKSIFADDLFTQGYPTDSEYEAINMGAPSDHFPLYITYRQI